MLSIPSQVSIFACTKAVDFRKQHDGLFAIVQNELKEDPMDGSLYIFLNRRRDRIKILVWDCNGLWLFYKRLEKGTFEKLSAGTESKLVMTRAKLAMLLDGFALEKVKKRKHFAEEFRLKDGSTSHDVDPTQATLQSP